jgi:hypothetical protein
MAEIETRVLKHIGKLGLYDYRDKIIKVVYYALKVMVWKRTRSNTTADVKRLKNVIKSLKIARIVFYLGRFAKAYNGFKEAYNELSFYPRMFVLTETCTNLCEELVTDVDTMKRIGVIDSYPERMEYLGSVLWTVGAFLGLISNYMSTLKLKQKSKQLECEGKEPVDPNKIWLLRLSLTKTSFDFLQSLPDTLGVADEAVGLVACCGLSSGVLGLYKVWIK